MKKYLLTGALITITATTLYATTAGSTVVDKMKSTVHAFTLATDLNPGETGLTSEPIEGKKTGDVLTAGEWNRMLELVAEGGDTVAGLSSPIVRTKHKPATTTSLTFDIPAGSRYATATVVGNGGADASTGAELENENSSLMSIVFDFQNNRSSGIHSINLGSSRSSSLEYSWEDQAFGTRVTLKEGIDTVSSAGWSTGVRPTISVTSNQLTISGLSSKEWTEIWMVTFH